MGIQMFTELKLMSNQKYNQEQKAMKITLAKKLKELRNSKGLSHEKLSTLLKNEFGLEISKQALINYEVTDEYHTKFAAGFGMNINYLKTFADFYKVSPNYLLGISKVKSGNADDEALAKRFGLGDASIRNLTSLKELVECIHIPILRTDFIDMLFGHPFFRHIFKGIMDYISKYAHAIMSGTPYEWGSDYIELVATLNRVEDDRVGILDMFKQEKLVSCSDFEFYKLVKDAIENKEDMGDEVMFALYVIGEKIKHIAHSILNDIDNDFYEILNADRLKNKSKEATQNGQHPQN